MNEAKCALRRACLKAVQAMAPAPASAADVCSWPSIQVLSADLPAVAETLRELAVHGYVVDLAPTLSPYYRLTAAGLDQLTGDARRDAYLWGAMGL